MSEGNTLLTREVTIRNKASKSAYYAKNAKFIELKPQRLGGSISAANAIKSQATLLKRVMPILTGVDPSDSKWHIHLGGYLDSITVVVSTNGKLCNTSLQFNSPNDLKNFEEEVTEITKAYSNTVKANPSKEKEAFKIRDEKLKVAEEKALLNAQPIDPNGYFIWRYALVHAEVANREVDANKSVKIRFFIYDDGERKRNELIVFELRTKANRLYFDILDKEVTVKAILNLMII
ncbi:MAG: hypothetical protein KAH32_07405, partial [Chlamydiia bacterium]|nr:hypothetical protein [Chlamydiia bacterium]